MWYLGQVTYTCITTSIGVIWIDVVGNNTAILYIYHLCWGHMSLHRASYVELSVSIQKINTSAYIARSQKKTLNLLRMRDTDVRGSSLNYEMRHDKWNIRAGCGKWWTYPRWSPWYSSIIHVSIMKDELLHTGGSGVCDVWVYVSACVRV